MTTNSEPLKLCKDCRWAKKDIPFFGSHKFMKCISPQVKTSLVTGEKEEVFCSVARMWSCGWSGDFWEKK